jgi:flavin-dependent dehydrogenase
VVDDSADHEQSPAMTKQSTREVDVAIIGGGLAGNFIARQLRRTQPSLRVGMYEKAAEPSFKVGESTVEVGSHYMLRRLGLSSYLYHHQLPKNGLRFFFDGPNRDGDLEQLSELGSNALPFLPSFQLDRATFERDMLQMNRDAGVAISTGAKVSRLELGEGGEAHHFQVRGDDGDFDVKSRWLVDASGRAALVSRAKDLRIKETHACASTWGRFKGVLDIDDLGSEEFRGRARYTSRVLSTNHFCYRGYWIWFIPLSSGVTSVGVVIDKARWRDDMRTADGFLAFLREHAAVAKLLEKAEMIDLLSFGQLAYGTKQFFSSDRWGLVGEAAAFPDPFYSPGTDFIALENDFLCDLISRDFSSQGSADDHAEARVERTKLYDDFMKFRFDATMELYRDQYDLLGSFELYSLKWDFDIASYYNLWLEPYMRDQHLDADYLRHQLRQRDLVLGVMKNFAGLFRQVNDHLEAKDGYHRLNLGHFNDKFPTMACAVELGTEGSSRGALRRTGEAFNLARNKALELLDRPVDESSKPLPISHFLAGKPLV